MKPEDLPEAWRPIGARALDYLASNNVPVASIDVEPTFQVHLVNACELEDPVVKEHVMIATQLAVGGCAVCGERG